MSAAPYAYLARISDGALLKGLKALLLKERRIEAELLAHIAEVDARKLYADRGFDCMHRYCVEELRLSESAAYHRIHAARAARRYPAIFETVGEGKLCLSALVILAPHLTPANHQRLLDGAAGLSKRQVEELVATMFPKPAAPAYVESVAEPRSLQLEDSAARPRPERRSAPASVEPMRPELYKVQFTADRAFREQLDELQALLRHQVPDGDLAEIFRRAVALLLEDTKRRRFAKTGRPRAAPRQDREPSRHIPADIKRAVYERDAGRCTYVAPNGRRCGSRAFLEYHHEAPWARHRRHRANEITLRCRAHNDLAARQEYGAAFMARRSQSPGTVRSEAEATVPGDCDDRPTPG